MVTTNGELICITECRFEPLHKGHVYMVQMSRELLAQEALKRRAPGYKLHVIVTSHDGEIINGHLRYLWAQKTFGGDPHIKVHSAHNSLEYLGYGTDYTGERYTKDWNFWGEVASKMCGLGDTIDYVFGSEQYVPPIAAACNAQPYLFSEDREAIQISGTIMRMSPYENWDHFPDAVKPFFAKKICITGGPSTGKARLARALAKHYNTPLIGDVSE